MLDYHDFVKILLVNKKAFTCNFNLEDPELLAIWYDNLKKFTKAELITAFNQLIQEQTFYPSIADLFRKLKPQPNPDLAGHVIASKIIEAISKFGYMRGIEAKEYLGEIGWEVVGTRGGWSTLCDMQNDEIGTNHSQMAKIAASKIQNPERNADIGRLESRKPNPLLQNALDLVMNRTKAVSLSIDE